MSDIYRNESRKDWRSAALGNPTLEQINTGTFQRIADACELMAKNHDALVRDRDWYKRRFEEANASSERLGRRINSLRGVITKMKRAAKAAGATP
jgi:hypothetical protein